MFTLDCQVLPDRLWNLHVFTDASTTGDSAVVYTAIEYNDIAYSSLLFVKSRLTLIKPATVLRTELLVAEVEAKTVTFVTNQLNLDFSEITEQAILIIRRGLYKIELKI